MTGSRLTEGRTGCVIVTWMMTDSVSLDRRNTMFRNPSVRMAAVLVAGALLGYFAASGKLNPFAWASAAPVPGIR